MGHVEHRVVAFVLPIKAPIVKGFGDKCSQGYEIGSQSLAQDMINAFKLRQIIKIQSHDNTNDADECGIERR